MSNCIDCPNESYSLPVGSTGSTGATGATGATGLPGATVLYDAAGTATAGTSYESIASYTMSNPSPLNEAGDRIEVIFHVENTVTSVASTATDKVIRFKIGSTVIGTTLFTFALGQPFVIWKLSIARVTNTTANITSEIVNLPQSSFGMILSTQSNYISTSPATVPDLDSGAHALSLEANSITAGDIECLRMIVNHYEKQ